MAVYVPFNIFFVSKLKKLSFAYAESSSLLKGKMVDSTSNVDTVQYTGSIEYEKRHIGQHIGKQLTSHLREWWWSEWILVTNGMMLALFILSMFGFGMYLISAGEISVGSLVMVITIVIGLEQRMFFLGQNLTQAVSYHGQVSEGLKDGEAFRKQAAVDAFADVPPDQLLTGLRGKDVLITFIESYGRSAIDDPRMGEPLGDTLAQKTRELKDAGFASRSGWLRSPITGAGSWLGHSTFLSGLWIKNQSRYNNLVASDRLTPGSIGEGKNLTKPETLPVLEGNNDFNQKKEWVEAIKAGKAEAAYGNFDYSSLLTETFLLGNIAIKLTGEKLEWDGPALKFRNNDKATQLVTKEYRKGWELGATA